MKKCNKQNCETCPYIKTGVEIKSTLNSAVAKLNSTIDCTSSNLVYCIFCNKPNCKQLYIGQTQRQLKVRFGEHKTSVRTKARNVIGEHFVGPGHSQANMEITGLEKVRTVGESIIEKRESLWIKKFEAEHLGLDDRK